MDRQAQTWRFLEQWHRAVDARDPDLLDPILAADVAISSPAYWSPKQDRAYVKTVLSAVIFGLEDFRYTGEWVKHGELILEFEGRIGGTRMRGIDRISLNDQGQMKHIEVFIRPINGLMALAEQVKGAF